jgi:hypothetical protein
MMIPMTGLMMDRIRVRMMGRMTGLMMDRTMDLMTGRMIRAIQGLIPIRGRAIRGLAVHPAL